MSQIFLDDERDPVFPEDWIIVRDYNDFVTTVLNLQESLKYISFDHDLGDGSLSGHDCVKYLIQLDQQRGGDVLDSDFEFYVHSQNPIGKSNIENLLNQYLGWKWENM